MERERAALADHDLATGLRTRWRGAAVSFRPLRRRMVRPPEIAAGWSSAARLGGRPCRVRGPVGGRPAVRRRRDERSCRGQGRAVSAEAGRSRSTSRSASASLNAWTTPSIVCGSWLAEPINTAASWAGARRRLRRCVRSTTRPTPSKRPPRPRWRAQWRHAPRPRGICGTGRRGARRWPWPCMSLRGRYRMTCWPRPARLGLLSDLIEIDPGLEAAFAAAAGDTISAVVVRGAAAARRVLHSLEANDAGAAVIALEGWAPPREDGRRAGRHGFGSDPAGATARPRPRRRSGRGQAAGSAARLRGAGGG